MNRSRRQVAPKLETMESRRLMSGLGPTHSVSTPLHADLRHGVAQNVFQALPSPPFASTANVTVNGKNLVSVNLSSASQIGTEGALKWIDLNFQACAPTATLANNPGTPWEFGPFKPITLTSKTTKIEVKRAFFYFTSNTFPVTATGSVFDIKSVKNPTNVGPPTVFEYPKSVASKDGVLKLGNGVSSGDLTYNGLIAKLGVTTTPINGLHYVFAVKVL